MALAVWMGGVAAAGCRKAEETVTVTSTVKAEAPAAASTGASTGAPTGTATGGATPVGAGAATADAAVAATPATQPAGVVYAGPDDKVGRLELSDAEWKKRLTPAQYYILREHGTERPFTGPYHDWHGKEGVFVCAGCGLPLFEAKTKYDSGTGWPSFYDSISGHVKVSKDTTFGMTRDALSCARCDGHLGHVFPDGPAPTGMRYCIDGFALQLTEAKESK